MTADYGNELLYCSDVDSGCQVPGSATISAPLGGTLPFEEGSILDVDGKEVGAVSRVFVQDGEVAVTTAHEPPPLPEAGRDERYSYLRVQDSSARSGATSGTGCTTTATSAVTG